MGTPRRLRQPPDTKNPQLDQWLRTVQEEVNNISVAAAAAGGASVTSTELSQQVSVLSNRISIASAAATSADTHANTVSANLATLSLAVSVISTNLSNELSVRAASVSVTSAAVTSVDARLNSVVSTLLSATGQVVPQIRTRGNVVSVISATALADIASISVSCAGAALYTFDGMVAFENATSGGFAYGCSTPALAAGGSFIHMMMVSTVGQNTVIADGNAILSAVAAGTTAVVSVSVATVNVLRAVRFEGMLATSAAGSFQLMAKTSVAGASMSVRGGYIRAYRLS